jgi:hypothetical protein
LAIEDIGPSKTDCSRSQRGAKLGAVTGRLPSSARLTHPATRAVLGDVEAPDEKAAEALAVKKFGLDEEQRKRLAVQEQA